MGAHLRFHRGQAPHGALVVAVVAGGAEVDVQGPDPGGVAQAAVEVEIARGTQARIVEIALQGRHGKVAVLEAETGAHLLHAQTHEAHPVHVQAPPGLHGLHEAQVPGSARGPVPPLAAGLVGKELRQQTVQVEVRGVQAQVQLRRAAPGHGSLAIHLLPAQAAAQIPEAQAVQGAGGRAPEAQAVEGGGQAGGRAAPYLPEAVLQVVGGEVHGPAPGQAAASVADVQVALELQAQCRERGLFQLQTGRARAAEQAAGVQIHALGQQILFAGRQVQAQGTGQILPGHELLAAEPDEAVQLLGQGKALALQRGRPASFETGPGRSGAQVAAGALQVEAQRKLVEGQALLAACGQQALAALGRDRAAHVLQEHVQVAAPAGDGRLGGQHAAPHGDEVEIPDQFAAVDLVQAQVDVEGGHVRGAADGTAALEAAFVKVARGADHGRAVAGLVRRAGFDDHGRAGDGHGAVMHGAGIEVDVIADVQVRGGIGRRQRRGARGPQTGQGAMREIDLQGQGAHGFRDGPAQLHFRRGQVQGHHRFGPAGHAAGTGEARTRGMGHDIGHAQAFGIQLELQKAVRDVVQGHLQARGQPAGKAQPACQAQTVGLQAAIEDGAPLLVEDQVAVEGGAVFAQFQPDAFQSHGRARAARSGQGGLGGHTGCGSGLRSGGISGW